MLSDLIQVVGLGLIVVGLVILFGAWAAVASGVGLVIVGEVVVK